MCWWWTQSARFLLQNADGSAGLVGGSIPCICNWHLSTSRAPRSSPASSALTPPPSPPTTPQLITSDLSSPPGPLPTRCQATAPTSGVITNDRNTPPLLVFPSTTFPTLWLPLTTDAPATVTPKNKFCLNSE